MTPKVTHFSLGKSLGSGTSAYVFEATSPGVSGGSAVALKVSRPGFEAHLVAEARLLSRIATPSCPTLLTAGWSDGAFFFAMPLVHGTALVDVPRSERSSVFRKVALGVAEALCDLHAAGYAHGDVKPENIVVEADRAVLLDFGLAAPFGRALSGGTPGYLPSGASLVCPENDLFALGRVLSDLVPDDRLALALCNAAPGLRPSAEAVSRAFGEDASVPRAAHISEARVRLAYLALRDEEIAPGCVVHAAVQGPSRVWLLDAIGWENLFSASTSTGAELGPLSPFQRQRFIASVFGYRAATIPIDDESESSFVARILQLACASSANASVSTGASPWANGSDAEIAASLVRGTADDALVTTLENRTILDPSVQLELVRYLIARGEFARAILALRERTDLEAELLRAEVRRRSGAPREALDGLPPSFTSDRRALAIAARAYWDLGDDAKARALATEAHNHEVLALVAYRAGATETGEREVEQGLFVRGAERGRLLGIRGMLRHAAGRATESMAAFTSALDVSQSIVEDASYGTGLAAAASDAGAIRVALEASTRSAFLWESLGRSTQAARALLARASTFAMLGSHAEALESLAAAVTLARRSGDALTECYAELGLAELGSAEAHLARAEQLAYVLGGDGSQLAMGRVRSARLALLPSTAGSAFLQSGDDAARNAPDHIRWEWWGARVRALSSTTDAFADGALGVLGEVGALLDVPAPVAVRGPAIAAAVELATALGQTTQAQRMATELARISSTVFADLPPRYRALAEGIRWLRPGTTADAHLSPAQMSEFSRIAGRFGVRESLRELFTEVLDAMLLWTAAERGVVLTRARDTLVPRASRNLRREDLRGEQLTLSRSLAEEALRSRKPIVATDAFAMLGDARGSIHALKLRSVLAVPLVARGEVLGVVYLDDRTRRDAFGAKELAWVSLLAVQAACAIADARDQLLLRRALRRAERAQKELAEVLSERESELAFAKRELRAVSRTTSHAYGAISGSSQEMREFLGLVDRVTDSDVPVLLLGESGTGKELVARAIHDNGRRSKHSFVTENCASVPENLLESTLFGHVRGAFTGASATRAGLLDIADRGTLFLDEIGEIPLLMQSKLLRVLQDGVVRPVGSDRTRKVDVRIVAATNRDLPKMVKEGTFRADLFYRLDVATLRVPALRDRADDIPELVHHFIQKYGGGRDVHLTPAAMKKLVRAPWPGNVRQLENEMRKLLLFAGDRIDAADVSDATSALATGEGPVDAFDLPGRIDALETELVQRALEKVGGNQTKAAELLRISRFGLQKMMKRLGITAVR